MVEIIEGYETEEQQVDAIKKWWNDNGTMLIVGAVIGLAGLWGWRYYGESVTASQEKASTEFAQVSAKFNAQGDAQDSTELKQFVAANEGNNYATLGALLLAKEAVDAGDFELAKTQLSDLLASNEVESLTPIIALRLARVSAELGEYDDALSTLNSVEDDAFLVKVNQVKGDIYLKQGDTDAARDAYQTAVDASEGRIDPVLQLQLNDLAVQQNATAPKLDDAQ
ncbi:YfgM family protein [Psychromonas sp. KJ10-2]|uniref:YfgM family protein n=1 Tax=Psychromonas sp. KJ10-2 TaxID=3391822 RepID=UPI0039B66DAE